MLSQSQIESFEANGFIVIQDVLTPEQLAEARRGVEALVEKSRSLTQSDEIFDLDLGHSAEKPMIARIKNAGTHVPFLHELGASDAFVDRAWPLIKGPGMLYHGCGRLNMKSAEGGSAVEWHQDTAYGPNTNGDNLTVGLYLDDTTTENGCMLMIPGSNKGPALDHHEDGLFVGGIGPWPRCRLLQGGAGRGARRWDLDPRSVRRARVLPQPLAPAAAPGAVRLSVDRPVEAVRWHDGQGPAGRV